MSNCFKVFFVSIITHLLELVSKFLQQHSQPSGGDVDQEELATAMLNYRLFQKFKLLRYDKCNQLTT